MNIGAYVKTVEGRGVVPILRSGVEASTLKELSTIVDAFATDHGYKHFSFAYRANIAPGQVKSGVYANYPQSWLVHYQQRGYLRCDPVINHLPNRIAPTTWLTLRSEFPSSETLFADAEASGMVDALSIPLHGPNGSQAVYSLVSDRVLLPEEIVDVGMAAMYVGQIVFSRAVDVVVAGRREKVSALSDRQRMVLSLVAQGQTVQDIATRLNLGGDTVREHLEKAKAKFGVSSREEAIVSAFVSGQIFAHNPEDFLVISHPDGPKHMQPAVRGTKR